MFIPMSLQLLVVDKIVLASRDETLAQQTPVFVQRVLHYRRNLFMHFPEVLLDLRVAHVDTAEGAPDEFEAAVGVGQSSAAEEASAERTPRGQRVKTHLTQGEALRAVRTLLGELSHLQNSALLEVRVESSAEDGHFVIVLDVFEGRFCFFVQSAAENALVSNENCFGRCPVIFCRDFDYFLTVAEKFEVSLKRLSKKRVFAHSLFDAVEDVTDQVESVFLFERSIANFALNRF